MKTKTQKDSNLVLAKEQVENADLYQPVMNKIMTTREQFIKCNFVAHLKTMTFFKYLKENKKGSRNMSFLYM